MNTTLTQSQILMFCDINHIIVINHTNHNRPLKQYVFPLKTKRQTELFKRATRTIHTISIQQTILFILIKLKCFLGFSKDLVMAEQKRRPNDKLMKELYAQNCRLVEIISAQKQIFAKQRESANFLRTTISHLVENEVQTDREFDQLHDK